MERVSSFKYLGVNISEDLTWTTHIQTQVKKARQRLYHLRQLRKFRVSPAILKTFYSGAIESVLTQCISVWYGNSSNQDCKALQRVVRLTERISGSTLPSLQDIYLKRCKSRAAKIIKDSTHPGNHLFRLLPSVHILFISILFILLFIKSHILFLHILLVLHFSLFYCTFYSLFLFFTYIYALVLCYFYIIFILLHCPLSGPDLIYISLLIILLLQIILYNLLCDK